THLPLLDLIAPATRLYSLTMTDATATTGATLAPPANPVPPTGSIHEDVVAAPEGHPVPTRVIAVAVDASPYSAYAFDWAVQNIIRPATDQVVLLNVRPNVSVPAVYGTLYVDFSKDFEKLEAANRKESHDLLRAFAARVPPGKFNLRGVALRGDPRDELAYKVKDIGADMLIIGSRGLGAIKRTFLGSVSDYLVHHLSIPVIIPRPSEDEKAIKG
ncbi:hypothetical protein HK405_011781, partial [Cladochytrium tenue]